MSKDFDYVSLFSRNLGIATLTSVAFMPLDIGMQHLHTKDLPKQRTLNSQPANLRRVPPPRTFKKTATRAAGPQFGKSPLRPSPITFFSILTSRTFLFNYGRHTLPKSIQGSFAKITGKEFTALDHLELKEEGALDRSELKQSKMPWQSKFGFLITCASIEALALQTISNKKILTTHANFEKQHGRTFVMPNLNTWHAKSKFHFVGMPAKMLRSSLQIAALVSVEDVQDGLGVSKNFAEGLLACSVGLGANFFDKIYMRQLPQINAKTVSAPSMKTVCKDIYKSLGWRGFFVGGLASIAYTAYAYPAISAAEEMTDGVAYHFTDKDSPLGAIVSEARASESVSQAIGKVVCMTPSLAKAGFFSMVKRAGEVERRLSTVLEDVAVSTLEAHHQMYVDPFSELPGERRRPR